MCQLKSIGKRCAAHTRPAYHNVLAAMTRAGDDAAEVATAVERGFDAITDYAMSDSGRPIVATQLEVLEQTYWYNPATNAAQEMARQATLATFTAALAAADARNEAIRAGTAAVRAAAHPAKPHHPALDITAFTITSDPYQSVVDREVLEPLRRRMSHLLPGDTFTVTYAGDTMTVSYDEDYHSETGQTTATLTIDTGTTTSQHTGRPGFFGDPREVLFRSEAWQQRRTLNNPHLRWLLAADYDQGLAAAAAPHTMAFDDFLTAYKEAYRPAEHLTPYDQIPKRVLHDLDEVTDHGRITARVARHHQTGPRATRPPTPGEVAASDYAVQAVLNERGIATYERLAAHDRTTIDAAQEDHTRALADWHAENTARQHSALRRLLPASPPPRPRQVERHVAPHPFGGMSKDEWIAYEIETMQAPVGIVSAQAASLERDLSAV